MERGRAFPIMVAGERLYVPPDAVFNVEHERSGREEELEFQVRWTMPAVAPAGPRKATARGTARGASVRRALPKKRAK